jgi:excisionase family DNA binding protein
MTDVTGPYYSPESAAQYLDIPLSTITDWRQKGVGPRFLRIGRRLVRYTKADLDTFMASSAGEALGARVEEQG